SCRDFDGGYTMCGMTGTGAAFVARDPAGIRPAYYYADDEVIVVASEKPAIKMSFNCDYSDIEEIKPGHAMVIDVSGEYRQEEFLEPLPKKSCSFERIYFSRASDPDIYHERKKLGKLVLPQILKEIDNDLANTVFSYIPNTAETAFFGLVEGLDEYLVKERKRHIREGLLFEEDLERLLSFRPRTEKLISKDVKLRTFITDDAHRDEMVSNVYETTFGVVKEHQDTIVLIDDSIVRGTTLERSILRMLDRLSPKKIVIVSSAPQIRYPDCYGIDMSKMKDFVAFRAVLKLLEENNREELLDETFAKCKDALENDFAHQQNFVKALYEPFTDEQISRKIAEIVTPKNCQAEISVIYQTVDGLHTACPGHSGDWYFTGDYPTPGGNKVVNQAFVNYMVGKGNERAYGAF
ncbi:MAG: amidophosphoribosyltransferase, partial [Siphonobacter aquaeclarae]|nr:amidophosphoribosyltransferase [Siphonobacter aquaeclarae]